MKHTLKTVFLLVLISSACTHPKDTVDYVDPFIGTDFFGHTFPGPSLPHAMVHLSPDVYTQGWTYCAGYVYPGSSIMGFSHTHWSGVGMVDGGDVLIMPDVGQKLRLTPGSPDNPDEGYRSGFDHKDETASAGYYSVLLKDCNVKAELTSTRRAGFHRYTFPEAENSRIIIDLGHQIGTYRPEQKSEIKIVNNNIIEGFRNARHGKVWFVAEFNKPFAYYGTFDADYRTPESDAGIFPYKNAEKGEKIGAFVYFRTSENEQVLVKVGISYTGIEGARKNLAGEIPHWDFDIVRNNARETWNKELSKIIIEDPSEEKKQIFYTALYHSLLAQYISNDVDGKYRGPDGKIHIAKDYDYYGSFSCWDTYRSQHPLLTIVAGEHVNDFIKSIESKTREYGWLPAQHFNNVFGESMVGDHLVPVIVDAFMKGYRDFDVDFLYDAMRTKALELPSPPVRATAGRSGLQYITEKGYIPADRVTESVSKTLEMAYDDWCIAQMARELGKEDDYRMFMSRALNYKNLWDYGTGFMRPRNHDGSWLEALDGHEQEILKEGDHAWYRYFDPLLVGRRPNRHYTESNAWQYIWSVQHDIDGLINLLGGKEGFVARLDTFFSMSPLITPPKYVGVVGTTGQYVHGNQPSHHVAYLYNYAGMPWKTQEKVRHVTGELYRTGPGGLCGNEDMGSLSSWYVFSAMGFYPVTPGSTYYVTGSPLFRKATIDTGNGKSFSVEAINNSETNIYIQSGSLNGRPLSRSWITHAEITSGGRLVFEMGPEPEKTRGVNQADLPPSTH
ncbi:MAG: GH92 family glycosyl hydrolase [Bacteroidales bacterium]|nr:GH92 family glycosyl hydrolase [Bacteroidales bacterium]